MDMEICVCVGGLVWATKYAGRPECARVSAKVSTRGQSGVVLTYPWPISGKVYDSALGQRDGCVIVRACACGSVGVSRQSRAGNACPDPGGASHVTPGRHRRGDGSQEAGAWKPDRSLSSPPKYVHYNILVFVWLVQGDSWLVSVCWHFNKVPCSTVLVGEGQRSWVLCVSRYSSSLRFDLRRCCGACIVFWIWNNTVLYH